MSNTGIEQDDLVENVKAVRKSNARRVINFRISDYEEELLMEKCKAMGINRSQFFRNAILDKSASSSDGSLTKVADDLSKTIAPVNTKIVKHPFAKIVMKDGIDVNLDGGETMKISNLSELFDFLQKYVFTKL